MNVYYLNDTNNLREWYTNDSVTWNDGAVNSQNIVASNVSSLTSVWHTHNGCVGCPNTLLVVYQDSSSLFNLGNLTSLGWTWSTLNANPVAGSGMSLDLMWDSSSPTSLRLYYQTSNPASYEHLCSLNWDMPPADAEAGKSTWLTFHNVLLFADQPNIALNGNWQNRETEPLNQISANASITSFTYGTVASNGLPIINAILDSSSHGVSSTFWLGSGGGAWSDGQTLQAMSATQTYTPLAANANAFVYAMQDGGVKEFVVAMDGSITPVGDVTTI